MPQHIIPKDITTTNITFTCQDGYQLTGTTFTPNANNRNAAVLFAPATGIKRGFYRNLALHLAQQGYACLTFDNRGIGDSLQGHVKDSKASLVDWGTLDLPSAFAELQNQFPEHQYHIVGHSAGGQLIGLIPGWQKIQSIFNFAVSSGNFKNMKLGFKIKALFFLNVFVPLSNKLFGYTHSEWVGMGEPLPAQVATDWAAWCGGKAGYVQNEFGKRITTHYYDEINCPSLWVNAKDDNIANNQNVKQMTSVFTQLPAERVELSPAKERLKEIGHMKFFSRKSKKLWVLLTDWLEQHT